MNLFLEANVKTNLPSKILLTFLFMFIAGCMIGYVLEVFFRRFVSAKKWVNPGFMKGPWLPLYGFGLVLMFALTWMSYSLFPSNIHFYNPTGDLFELNYQSGATVYDLIQILILGSSMILLEFVAGLIFVKGFKVRLWDYTNMKGNIMGIICPVFSVIWFIVAIIFYYGLNPFVYDAFKDSYNFMFGNSELGTASHFGFIFILGIIYGVFLIDFINSVGLLNKVSKIAKESNIVARYEKLAEDQKKQRAIYKKKLTDALPESLKRTKEKDKLEDTTKKFSLFMRKILLVDPSKTDNKGNYDEHGRPIKEDQLIENKEENKVDEEGK